MLFICEDEDFHEIYVKAVREIIERGLEIETTKGATLELTLSALVLTDISRRKIRFFETEGAFRQKRYERYLEKELEWYLSGSLKASEAPSKSWKEFAYDGKIQSNYGHLIFHEKRPYRPLRVTNFEFLLDLLRTKPTTRQAILHYNLPKHYKFKGGDIPCTVCAQIFIRNNRLDMIVYQRSCDLYTGLPYDLPWHCHLMNLFAENLRMTFSDLLLGSLTMVIGSMHMYQKDLEFFRAFLKEKVRVGA